MSADERRPELTLVIPAYNEEANIESVVRAIHSEFLAAGLEYELLVVDDGSQDATAARLEELAGEISPLRPLGYEMNQGYGFAVRTGLEAARGRYVAIMDADDQFHASDVVRLYRKIEEAGCDGVAGYRVEKQDRMTRVVGDRVYNFLVSVLCWTRFRDHNCAMKIFRREAIERLHLESIGFSLPTEIVVKASYLNLRLEELPIEHRLRVHGATSLRFFRHSFVMGIFIVYLAFKVRIYRRGLIDRL